MRIKARLCSLIVAVGACLTAHAEDMECTQAAAIAAETQPRPQTWDRLYKSFTWYGQCDDGSVAEAWSDFVATLLAERWETLPDLYALTKAHRSFGKFVLRHLDETMTLEQAKTIKHNAKDSCPAVARAFCDRILRRMNDS
jgi:hypothetical protein